MAKKPTHIALIAINTLRSGVPVREVASFLILEEGIDPVKKFVEQFMPCNNGQSEAEVARKVATAADEILNLKR